MNEYVFFDNKYRKVYTRKNGTKYFLFEKKRRDVGNIPLTYNNRRISNSSCKPDEEIHVNNKCYKKCSIGKVRSVITNRCVTSARQPSPPRQPSPLQQVIRVRAPVIGNAVFPLIIKPFLIRNNKILNHHDNQYYKINKGVGKQLNSLKNIISNFDWTVIQFSKHKENITNMMVKDILNNYKLDKKDSIRSFHVYNTDYKFILEQLNVSQPSLDDKENFTIIVHKNRVIFDTELERYLVNNLGKQPPVIFIPQPGTAMRSPMHGKPEPTIIAMIYLAIKHKNISCMPGVSRIANSTVNDFLSLGSTIRFSDFKIEYHFNRLLINKTIKDDINECLKNNKRFIIMPIGFKFHIGDSRRGHAGLLIYDKTTQTLERFEPHGQILLRFAIDIVKNFDNKIIQRLRKDTNMVIKKYLKPIDFCPRISFQALETGPGMISDPGGFCQSWILYYSDLRMRNPNINRKTIIEHTIDYIRLNQLNFKKLIRGYSYMLRHIFLIVTTSSQLDTKISDIIERLLGR